MTVREQTAALRKEVIQAAINEAKEQGKGTGLFKNPVTGVEEHFTYIRKHNGVELIEVRTNAEEIYPPFRDQETGRIIKY